MSKEEIIKKLQDLGWYNRDYYNCFEYFETGRYVEIDLPYIDFYIYKDEEKYKGYLDVGEFKLFYKLVEILMEEQVLKTYKE